ncbi:cytochrome o ubiquinol oxidase subunit IV [Vibrio coralliilyticus]|uniref:cytochrome o ubiquinol oxidase subunit IV n=1 Tax=Vibrio coralliilyticus TaxID=190893 RepID=UPI000BAADC6B|nr:cytochrome o ubiquinol oxidase subunit IV [Vibrio coralliilyticus]NOI57171.1 cytochrome o ubiquinol oxidase subunit IV [Vibrio coralliilyticus]PAT69939.1 cytochrome o ubiquinol oxidase subunit IV [Vibrio coralliilyticus]
MDQHLETGASDYVKGFVASLILTVIPFYFVWTQSLPETTTYVLLFGCALVQIFVHFKYFLHMEVKTSDGRWNLVSLMFTAIVVLILIAGSVWIIYNMNVNMKL